MNLSERNPLRLDTPFMYERCMCDTQIIFIGEANSILWLRPLDLVLCEKIALIECLVFSRSISFEHNVSIDFYTGFAKLKSFQDHRITGVYFWPVYKAFHSLLTGLAFSFLFLPFRFGTGFSFFALLLFSLSMLFCLYALLFLSFSSLFLTFEFRQSFSLSLLFAFLFQSYCFLSLSLQPF